MLGLKLVTDPRWQNIVESNIEEILTVRVVWTKSSIERHKFDHTKILKRVELITELMITFERN
jgi:tRNA-(ms[2]io[6]A)-hydroxylase